MNAQAVEALIEKLKSLPPEQRAEVEGFVDFLRARKERPRDAATQRLGEAFKKKARCPEPAAAHPGRSSGRDRCRARRATLPPCGSSLTPTLSYRACYGPGRLVDYSIGSQARTHTLHQRHSSGRTR